MKKWAHLLDLPAPHGVVIGFDGRIMIIDHSAWMVLCEMDLPTDMVIRLDRDKLHILLPEMGGDKEAIQKGIGWAKNRPIILEPRQVELEVNYHPTGIYLGLRVAHDSRVGWVLDDSQLRFRRNEDLGIIPRNSWPADWRYP